MQEVIFEQVVNCLCELNIEEGDGLLVHSAIQFLGRPSGGIGMYLDAILKVIGEDGTIAVPTFNFGFAKGERYDPETTPSQGMGTFSEYVRQQPDAKRTRHPMQSLAIIGQYAEDLASRDTRSAFDPGSAFERLLDLDFKLLLLGADERAISIFHYSEQRAQVPYRYWKDFPGQIRSEAGWEEHTYRMYVRDMDLNPQLTLKPVVALMKARQQWHSLQLNYGQITTCRLVDFVRAADEILAENPWNLVLSTQKEIKQ